MDDLRQLLDEAMNAVSRLSTAAERKPAPATKYAANRAWHELYKICVEFDRDTADPSRVCSECGAPK